MKRKYFFSTLNCWTVSMVFAIASSNAMLRFNENEEPKLNQIALEAQQSSSVFEKANIRIGPNQIKESDFKNKITSYQPIINQSAIQMPVRSQALSSFISAINFENIGSAESQKIIKSYSQIAGGTKVGNLILGLMHEGGRLTNFDQKKSEQYYNQALSFNNSIPLGDLQNDNEFQSLPHFLKERLVGFIKFYGEFGLENKPEGLASIMSAASKSDDISQLWLGHLYNPRQQAIIFQHNAKDAKEALKYYGQAAALGNIAAQYYAGSIPFDDNSFTDAERSNNFIWLTRAADNNHIQAKFKAGCLLIEGTKITKNTARGINYLVEAANCGVAKAKLDLGNIYYHGLHGVPVDYDKAIDWYEKAQQEQHQLLQESLQNFMYDGNLHNNLNPAVYKKLNIKEDLIVQVKSQVWRFNENENYKLQKLVSFRNSGTCYATLVESQENLIAGSPKEYNNGYVKVVANGYQKQSRNVKVFPDGSKVSGDWYNTGAKRAEILHIIPKVNNVTISGSGPFIARTLINMCEPTSHGSYVLTNFYPEPSGGIILNGSRVLQF